MFKFIMFCILIIMCTACGYKPSSHVINHIFSDTVYVEVHVDNVEPENAPFLKDEMNRLVYTRFQGHVTSKEKADTQIIVSYEGSTYSPLASVNGYVTRYRANIRVKFDMVTRNGKESKTIMSIVESDIQASSLTSTALRIEAIRKGLKKALDEFLAYVSAKGIVSVSASK